MPLTRFKLSAIEDGGIATADLADGSVTTAKIADSAVTSVKTSALFTNTEIAGTEGARMPNGTTAQRANAQGGDIRFNTTLSLMEYYTGTEWKSIDSPPTVTSLSPTTIVDGTTVTVTGSNFQSGINVSVIGSDGTAYTPASIVRTNNTTITFDATAAMISGSLDYFDVKVTNASNLSATLENALEITSTHTWATAAGSLGTIYDAGRSGHSFNAGTTYSGGESDVTVTHSITSGTLPSGLSINSSTGVITGGTSAVGSDVTTNITVQYSAADASAGTTVTGTRNFSIIQKSPTITSYTSTGSGTFSVPTGVATLDVLVVAGGGTGGGANSNQGTDGGGGGGAGGLIFRPAFPVTPGGSVSYTVGAGGTGQFYGHQQQTAPQRGQDSVFGTLTSKGGGAGQAGPGNGTATSSGGIFQGGSGGGAGGGGGTGSTGVTAVQPQQPSDSGTYGFGYPGGSNTNTPPYNGNGGGGAGGVGTVGSDGNGNPVPGGAGRNYSISGSSVGYSGGGAGGGGGPGAGAGGSATHGGGTSHPAVDSAPLNGDPGDANRGGGGGGGAGLDSPRPWNSGYGGTGGSGIIVVKY
jgi:hypothetical protein